MGADLIIKPIFLRNYQKYEPEFRHWVQVRDALLMRGDTQGADKAQQQVAHYLDQMHAQGYFRDYYNSSGLLTKFNLSWKNNVDTVLTNQHGKMRCWKTRRFLRLLADREPTFEMNLRTLKLTKGRSRARVARSYHMRYAQLKGLLEQALDRRQAITCSL